MKIIVTGGAGFIGSALVRHLINRTMHEVLVVDKLTYAGNLASLASVEGDGRFHFSHTDICDRRAVTELVQSFDADSIMHLAAESHVDRSIDEPADFISTNIVGTYALLEVALEHWRRRGGGARDFRFHHVSTDEVFGALANDDSPFTEDTRYDPRSPYSATKAASDHLVRAWAHTYGLPAVLSNCSNNYGPHQFVEKLIPLTILKCLASEQIPVYGQGANIRDWLFVDDHVEALTLVLETGRIGETYNIGGNAERRNVDVVNAVCDAMDGLLPRKGRSYRDFITFVPDRPGHDFRYAINCSKIKAELGWTPKYSFESGLTLTVQWYIDNRAWWEPLLRADNALRRHGLAIKGS